VNSILWSAVLATGAAFGGFAWLFVSTLREGGAVYAEKMGAETSRQFEDAFLFVSAKRISDLGKTGAIAAFFLFFIPLFSFSNPVSTLAGIGLGLAAGAYVFTLPAKYAAFVREKRKLKFETQLVEALGTMSNALRAGFSINQAFESVVENGEPPISQEFAMLLQQLRVGMTFEDALLSMDNRMKSDDLTLVVTSIDIARRTGGNLTEIFDRISETIRGRMRIQMRVRTLTAQGRMQGKIVSCMPLVLGGFMFLLKPGMMIPFVFSLGGAACLGGALVLIVLGWLVIKKIVTIDV